MTAVADGAADACRTEHGTSATVTATQCVAIAKIPLGSRVLAGNPRPWEFDDSLPEPDRATWRVVTLVLLKDDLTTVEIQMLRPLAWIDRYGIESGKSMQLHVPELGIARPAEIVSVGPCPAIAEGEGRVVTARFVTRNPGNVVRLSLANGTAIRATDVHPVWSVDREDWVPAGELATGERLDTLAGPVAVVGVERIGHHPTVYNLEVHGEHVYRVTEDGVLVHNAGPRDCLGGAGTHGHHSDPKFMGGDPKQALTDMPVEDHKRLHAELNQFLRKKTDEFGNHMRPQRGNSASDIQQNFSREERLDALKEFYRTFRDRFPDAAHDFFVQHPDIS